METSDTRIRVERGYRPSDSFGVGARPSDKLGRVRVVRDI